MSGTSDFEVVPVDQEAYKLDPVGLAMGAAMVTSKKRKRDMIDGAFNRYMTCVKSNQGTWGEM